MFYISLAVSMQFVWRQTVIEDYITLSFQPLFMLKDVNGTHEMTWSFDI